MRPMNHSFTNPLGLEKQLSQQSGDANIFAILNVVLVVLGFFMLNSRFLAAPGLELELPRLAADMITSVVTESVLTVTDSNMLLFDGRIYSFSTIESALNQSHQTKTSDNDILLLKMDHRVSIEVLLKISEIAHQAGFKRVQIAGLPAQPGSRNEWEPSVTLSTH